MTMKHSASRRDGFTPTGSSEVATKGYVDGLISGGGGGGIPGYVQIVGAVTGGTPVTITHSLNSLNVDIVVWRTFLQSGGLTPTTPGEVIDVKWRKVDANHITLEPDDSWAANEFAVAVNPIPVTMDTTGPPAGTLTTTGQTTTTISLTLTGGVDAGVGNAGVNWYRTLVSSGVQTLAATTAVDTLVDTGLTANTAYSYVAKRFDYFGTEGPASAALPVSTSANLSPPTFDANSISAPSGGQSNTLSLSWSHPAGAAAGAIVAVPLTNNGSGGFVVTGTPTCTVGGTSLTYRGVQLMGNATNAGWIAVFTGLIPSSGSSRTVNVSVSSSGQNLGNAYGTCDTYLNVASFGSLVTAQAINTACTLTVPSGTSQLVWAMFGNYATTGFSSPNFTQRRLQGSSAPWFISGDKTGVTSTVVSVTQISSIHWAGVGVNMLPGS